MQNWAGPDSRRRLANAVLVHEVLRDGEALAFGAEHGGLGHPDVVQRHVGVVGRHVEGPQEAGDLETRRVGRHQESGDAARRPWST